MCSCHRDSEPNKWEQRIWEPVFPTQILDDRTVRGNKIEPHVKKLVETQAWNIVDPKAVRDQIFLSNVVVSLEVSNRPTDLTVFNLTARSDVPISNASWGHCVA